MEFKPADKRFQTQSISFDDLRSAETRSKQDALYSNIPVKSSFTPSRKIIIAALATIAAVAIISTTVTVLVVFLKSNGVTNWQIGGDTSTSNLAIGSTTSANVQQTSANVQQTTSTNVQQTTSTNVQQTMVTTMSTLSPVAGSISVWTEWGNWTTCAVTCGAGIQTRYRSCQRNAPDDIDCIGDYVERKTCHSVNCPVYGIWTTWSSWNGCSASCGGGIQSRTRLCQKTPSVLNCVGAIIQSQSCNSFNCPDCNRMCSSGILSDDCDRCVCSAIVSNRIIDGDNFPLSGVIVAEVASPYKILAESGSSGTFTLNSSCPGTEILLRKEKYQDKTVTISTTDTVITMEHIVLPYIISHPYSKYRLSGENVTICCIAGGSPIIGYYEWFKDGILLDISLYPNGTSLMLSNVTFLDSGQYRCRANSLVGSVQSEHAIISVRDTSTDFCEDAYQQKMNTLPDDCVQPGTNSAQYEVGECLPKLCRQNESSSPESCERGTTSCCGVSGYRHVIVNCTGYQITVLVVVGCSCQQCNSDVVYIEGTVKGMDAGNPLVYGEILVNGALETYTDEFGTFSILVGPAVRQLTITAKDTYSNQFLEATNVFNIPEALTGPFKVTINMFSATEPVKLSSSVKNTIYLGKSSNSSIASVAEIIVPPNAYIYQNGSQYDGTVSASLTFLDPTNLTILENIPGVFQFTDNEGNTQNLDTLGVFGLFFRDNNGNPLTIDGTVDMFLSSDILASDPNAGSEYQIWGLSEITGKWEVISSDSKSNKRKRRQVNLWMGEISMRSYTWYNVDKLRNPSTCYFKTRIYQGYNFSDQFEVSEVKNYIYLTFPIFRDKEGIYQSGYTMYPKQTCHEAICNGYQGFLELYHYDYTTYERETLIPANTVISKYIGMDEAAQNLIGYKVSDNGRVLSLRFNSSDNGPFFKNRQTCLNSTSLSNHFRFYLNNTNPDVYTYLHTLFPRPGLPNISALVWNPENPDRSFRVCYIRIRLNFISLVLRDPIKLRVISYGGTHAETKGKMFGIREVQIWKNNSICIEYKCSGKLQLYVTGEDLTQLKIFPIITSGQKCNISVDNLADFVTVSTSNKNNVGLSVYENYAPTFYNRNDGVFQSTTDSYQRENSKKRAYYDCAAGVDPAVVFTCG